MLTHSLDIKLQSRPYRLWPNLGLWARRGYYKILFLTPPPRQNLRHCLTCSTVDKKKWQSGGSAGIKSQLFKGLRAKTQGHQSNSSLEKATFVYDKNGEMYSVASVSGDGKNNIFVVTILLVPWEWLKRLLISEGKRSINLLLATYNTTPCFNTILVCCSICALRLSPRPHSM